MENILYYGDNLDILRRYIPDESIDLVNLDPPSKSNQDYKVVFNEQNGPRAGLPAPRQLVLDRGKDLNEFYQLIRKRVKMENTLYCGDNLEILRRYIKCRDVY